jgi:hypothetical protein
MIKIQMEESNEESILDFLLGDFRVGDYGLVCRDFVHVVNQEDRYHHDGHFVGSGRIHDYGLG